ncbi:unnamed protein product [Didymodactylos carnosus]|uniref:PCI domain-containing protein n=1 Tax=Didymodactylos carnosus TaxID=1234261 RepID=A0A814A0F2_9BILA|nr:unnamed protein product [Didymodactylos carnosus]CAF0905186.1 unnamed protein product [Didymodactylos carnosus]CAF3515531.1 unnamed protein product [Didymodactylos carnosus]CAF3687044.1 unnamed protein product [Didymodactylos carnosus]
METYADAQDTSDVGDDFIYARTKHDFIDSILNTAQLHDGNLLQDLLNVSRMHKISTIDFSPTPNDTSPDNVEVGIDHIWKTIAINHWLVCQRLNANDVNQAYQYQLKKFHSLLAIFNNYSKSVAGLSDNENDEYGGRQITSLNNMPDEPTFLLPVFNRIVHELRLLSLLVHYNNDINNENTDLDDDLTNNSTVSTCINLISSAMNVVQRLPSTGVDLQSTSSERLLKQHTQQESRTSPVIYSSYILTYRYFLAKSLMFKHRYDEAIEHFEYVFKNSYSQTSSIKNKQKTLLYLTICKMLYGFTPKLQIIEKYNLTTLYNLIYPIKIGSLALFNERIKQYEEELFDNGLLFLIENLKLICIRNLFRHYLVVIEKQQLTKIPLESCLLVLLNFQQNELYTINELIDLLNIMVQSGMIKGYISHKFRFFVISKNDPFPKQYRFTSLLNN